MSAGVKYDASKPKLYITLMQFPLALQEISRVNDFGAAKYTLGGWRTVLDAYGRYSDALIRHTLAQGQDSESGLSHAAHAAWNALARLELELIATEGESK